MRLYQWVIVRDNCETWVTWAVDLTTALREFRQAGFNDAWRALIKSHRDVPDAQEAA